MTLPQAVILAGGLGTRLKPITDNLPKPLVPVKGKPFLEWQLMDLKHQGFFHILLLVSYMGEKIVDEFQEGERLGLKIDYSFEPEPLGTGGALVHARKQLADTFVMLNGDSFLRAPLKTMVADFYKRHLKVLVATYDNHKPTPVPNNLKTEDGMILAYEKLAGKEKGFDSVDAGAYVISKDITEDIPEEKFQVEELWSDLIAKKEIGAFPVNERFYDIGTLERLRLFEEKIHDYFPHAL